MTNAMTGFLRKLCTGYRFWPCLPVLLIGATAAAGDLQQRMLTAERINQHISELQAGGPYQPALIEALAELAAYHEEQQDHAAALELYGEALQVSRVNNGLYHPQQLPLMQRLIDNHRALAQWQQVDDLQHLLFFTERRVQEPESAEYRRALLRLVDWRLEAWRQNLLRDGARDQQQVPGTLQESWGLLEQALEHPDVPDHERFELLYGRALVELAIAHHMTDMPLRAFDTSTPRYTNQRVCRNVVDQNGITQRMCWTEQVENPAFRSAQRDARRTQMDRATLRFRRTVEALDELDEARDSEQRQQQVATLQSQVSELQQASRRALLRSW